MSRRTEPAHAVQTRGLRKDYGRRTAVHDLDLDVPRGTVVGLIGTNGAGKTTAMRMLLDLLRPTAGELTVLGTDPRVGGPALRRRIGYLPGDARLASCETGRALLHRYARISGPVAPGAVEVLAERLGADLARPVRQLSKGNRQKIGLVQAFMHAPELLVLDEPTSGLDPLVQREFLGLVREAREDGRTVLLSSHVLTEIQQTADEVVVLSRGRVVAQGDVASLRLGGSSRVHALVDDATVTALRGWADALGRVTELDDVLVDAAPGAAVVRLALTVRGPIDPVVKALAQLRVRDLTVEEPDLEESVLGLYSREEER